MSSNIEKELRGSYQVGKMAKDFCEEGFMSYNYKQVNQLRKKTIWTRILVGNEMQSVEADRSLLVENKHKAIRFRSCKVQHMHEERQGGV